jgi:hypothetical protein
MAAKRPYAIRRLEKLFATSTAFMPEISWYLRVQLSVVPASACMPVTNNYSADRYDGSIDLMICSQALTGPYFLGLSGP